MCNTGAPHLCSFGGMQTAVSKFSICEKKKGRCYSFATSKKVAYNNEKKKDKEVRKIERI
jgi:hypothetical protein